MAIVKIVPMPGPSDGQPANTGNFVFDGNNVTTDENMGIAVNGVPGRITLSAYEGVDIEASENFGLRFPDGTVQTTAYTPAAEIIPLPDFLTYVEGRDHLSSLNSNFGWNSEGLWFGYSGGEGSTSSYPVFTNFTIGQNDAVTVEFNVNIQDECSDVGLCVYLDEDTPQWQWGISPTRIAAQFDCVMPVLLGIDDQYIGEVINIPDPGMYRVKFTYNPIGGTPVQFEYYQGNTLINSMTLNQVLGAGNYRVGFASDNNSGRTYISDLSIMVNEDAPYIDTLQNGNSGTSADIADFVFDYNGEESTMTIHNHDMTIRTTRDDNQDADISINSADDVWITSNDTLELTSITDDVVIITDDGGNTWNFKPNGDFELPGNLSRISSGIDGQIVVDSINATFYNFYDDSSLAIMNNTGVSLPINADSMWFINNGVRSATITFADATTIQATDIYDATSQGTPAIVFAWSSNITKSFEEAFPMTIGGAMYVDNNYVALNSRDAQWRFDSDGKINFPLQGSNARTGSGEVLRFGNSAQQSIITGAETTGIDPTAQRLVIAGQDGHPESSGEGGDIYLWAGRGGSAGGSGGDIKVDAGSGGGDTGAGGTIKVRGGYSQNSNGGFVDISAGDSSMASGGNISIAAGTNYSVSEAAGGNVSIYGGGSADPNSGGSIFLATYQNGKVVLSGEGGEFLNDPSNANNQIATLGDIGSGTGDITFDGVQIIGAGTAAGDGSLNGTIELVPDGDLNTDQYLVIDPTAPNHIHIRAGGTQDASSADLFLGGERTNVQISDQSGNVNIKSKILATTVTHQNIELEAYGNLVISGTGVDIALGDYFDANYWNGSETLVGRFEVANISEQDGNTVVYAGIPGTGQGYSFEPLMSYTFYRDNTGENQWTFSNDGTLYGPLDGNSGVKVNALYAAYDLPLIAQDHLILHSQNGEYLNDVTPNKQIATIGDIANYAPVETDFTVNGGTLGIQPTFDGSPMFSGSYIKIGPQVHFQIQVDMDNITSFGTGQYYVDLPFPAKYGYKFREGCLHDISTGKDYEIGGHVLAGQYRLNLSSTDAQGNNVFDIPFVYNNPVTLDVADNFHISGTYITAS